MLNDSTYKHHIKEILTTNLEQKVVELGCGGRGWDETIVLYRKDYSEKNIDREFINGIFQFIILEKSMYQSQLKSKGNSRREWLF